MNVILIEMAADLQRSEAFLREKVFHLTTVSRRRGEKDVEADLEPECPSKVRSRTVRESEPSYGIVEIAQRTRD